MRPTPLLPLMGLTLALGAATCRKEPMDQIVDDLVDTCYAVEETDQPCGFRRGDLSERYGSMCLDVSGMQYADKKLQEKTDCRLSVFQRTENGALDYLVQRKSCDLHKVQPNSDLLSDYQKIYPE